MKQRFHVKLTIKKLLLSLLPAAALTACSGSKEFRLDAASDDIGTQNVTVIYSAGDGYRIESVPAIDGQFSLTGSLSSPTFAEVYTNSGSLLGEFIVEGGDHIKARFSALNPENIKIEGNDDAELLASFLKDNRQLISTDDSDGLNRAIEAFVKENPKQFASTVLVTRYFTVEGYEDKAAELLSLIPDKYRRANFSEGFEQMLNTSLASDTIAIDDIMAFSPADTAISFSPAGTRLNLLMLTDNDTRPADSIKEMIAALRAGAQAEEALRITDLGCDRDTLVWHASLRAIPEDYPAGVYRMWLNAGMATSGVAEASPTTIPYFILTDSAGKLLYRGPSASATRAAFGNLRKRAR